MSSVDEGPGAGAPEQPRPGSVAGDAATAAADPAGGERHDSPLGQGAPPPAIETAAAPPVPPTGPVPPVPPTGQVWPNAPGGPGWPGSAAAPGAPWPTQPWAYQPGPTQPGAPAAAGWSPPPPPAAGGGSWGPPPWGWSPYQEGAPASPPPAPGAVGNGRKPAPWVVAVLAAALALVGLGVGVAIGYGVWSTSQPTGASFRPGAIFPPGGSFSPATQSNRAFLGVEVVSDSGSGARVVAVLGTSPAAKAGLADGDTITKLGTTTVTSPASLRSAVDSHKPGQKVTITWTTSAGKKQTATVTLSNASSVEG
jgi:hypothetical protein